MRNQRGPRRLQSSPSRTGRIVIHSAGIHSAAALRALGPDEAYGQLLASGSRPHFIGYYVLVMGLQGRPWNDCKGEEKKQLRKRFDAICAAMRNSDTGRNRAIDEALSQIGVIAKPL